MSSEGGAEKTSFRPGLLAEGAYEAIHAEHQRDHDDGPNEPREGCPGCALLAEIGALRALVAEAWGVLAHAMGELEQIDETDVRPRTKRALEMKLAVLEEAVEDAMDTMSRGISGSGLRVAPAAGTRATPPRSPLERHDRSGSA